MATSLEQAKEFLNHADPGSVEVTQLDDGSLIIKVITHKASNAQQLDTTDDSQRWKQALRKTRGLWADRPNIGEDMRTIRQECDRSFSAQE